MVATLLIFCRRDRHHEVHVGKNARDVTEALKAVRLKETLPAHKEGLYAKAQAWQYRTRNGSDRGLQPTACSPSPSRCSFWIL